MCIQGSQHIGKWHAFPGTAFVLHMADRTCSARRRREEAALPKPVPRVEQQPMSRQNQGLLLDKRKCSKAKCARQDRKVQVGHPKLDEDAPGGPTTAASSEFNERFAHINLQESLRLFRPPTKLDGRCVSTAGWQRRQAGEEACRHSYGRCPCGPFHKGHSECIPSGGFPGTLVVSPCYLWSPRI